jgi:hypothetical protein
MNGTMERHEKSWCLLKKIAKNCVVNVERNFLTNTIGNA